MKNADTVDVYTSVGGMALGAKGRWYRWTVIQQLITSDASDLIDPGMLPAIAPPNTVDTNPMHNRNIGSESGRVRTSVEETVQVPAVPAVHPIQKA